MWCAAGPATLGAQTVPPPVVYAIDAWTIADGLPQTDIRGLTLDREGYLWLGTNLGLTRFDGRVFEEYPRTRTPDVPSPVWDVVTGRDGTVRVLWPRLGVGQVHNDGTLEQPRGPPLPDFRFQQLAVTGDTAWVTTGSGLRLFSNGAWSNLPEFPDNALGSDLTIVADRYGSVWVGGSNGLAQVTQQAERRVNWIGGLACRRVRDVTPAAGAGVWVVTCAGLEHVSADGRRTSVVIPRPLREQPYRVAASLDPDVIWLADARGVQRLQVRQNADGSWRVRVTFEDDLDLGGSPIVALQDDNNGGVWAGSPVAGLRHVRRLPARRLDFADGLPERAVHHLAPDGHGGMWIGTGTGLAHWRGDGVRVYRPPALGLESSLIQGLLLDRSGRLWIGQQDALVRVDAKGEGHVEYRLATAGSRSVAPMLQDRRGRIWFGSTEGDVGYLEPSEHDSILVPQVRLSPEQVWSMAEDAQGGIWAGQVGQLSRLVDTVVVERVTEADGLPPGQIRGLAFDSDGSLWIAAYGGGLAVWRAGQGVKRFLQGAGRHDRMLSAVRIDRDGRFWVFGDGGVRMFLRAELAEALAARRPVRPAVELGIGGGVPEGNNGIPNTWLDDTSGWLWLATVNGAATVNTLGASLGQVPISTRIDELVVNGLSRGVPDSLALQPAPSVDIWFSSPWTSGVTSGGLRYRLTGHDPDWIEAGTARVAHYAKLARGVYRFELATGFAGELDPHVARVLTLRVDPYWWETTAARVGSGLLALTALWGVIMLFTGRLRRRNLALQQLLDDREEARRAATEAARDLAHVRRVSTAGELATSIAHELNQPLTAIMGTAQKARHVALESAGGELVPALGVIVEQAERAAGVIRSLRSFVQKGAGRTEDVSVGTLMTETLRLVGHELHDRSVRIDVEAYPEGQAVVRGDSVQLQQVLVNLLLNAADSMEAIPVGDRVIRVQPSNENASTIRISVSDSGPGIPPAALARVFEPFYSTKQHGLGLGLALSRSIVESHGGRLWAESPAEGGAIFHVVLPLVNS